MLILIAPFYPNKPQKIYGAVLRDELDNQLKASDLRNVRVEWLQETTFSPNEGNKVHDLAEQYGALLVIWGYADSTNVVACYTVNSKLLAYHKQPSFNGDLKITEKLQRADDFNFIVNDKLPYQVQSFAFFTLGYLYYWADRTGKGYQAETALTKTIETVNKEKNKRKKPDTNEQPKVLAPAYFYLGNLYAVIRQNRQSAIDNYRKALEVDSSSAKTAYNLGQSLRFLANSYRHKAQDAKQTIKDMKKTTFNLGKLLRILNYYYHYQCYEYRAQVAYRQAIRAYSKCIVINHVYVLAYEQRGLAHWEIGHNKAAVKDYKSALKLRSGKRRDQTYYRLGLALRDLGLKPKYLNCPYRTSKDLSYLNKALKQFDRALRYAWDEAIDGRRKSTYYLTRGYLHEYLGNESAAIKDWKEYLRLCSPKHKYQDEVKAKLAQKKVPFEET